MTAACVVAAALAWVVSLVRWLRVSQREHYIPGQAKRTAQRWIACRPPNRVVAWCWAVLALATGATRVLDLTVASAGLGIAAAAVGAAFPVGMPILGTPRLRLTRRARTQASVAVAMIVAHGLILGWLVGWAIVAAMVGLFALGVVDLAARVVAPVERRLAAAHVERARRKLDQVEPRVVAVTGSYGKTTVKNHIRDLLAPGLATVASPASWNNQAGLSRTINEHLAPGSEVLVAELGTYGPGEIASLVSWLRPEVAVITAIGPVHLERMGSLEGVLAAKREILDDARVAVLCVDHPLLDGLADELGGASRPSSPAASAGKVDVWRVGTQPDRDDLDVRVTVAAEPAGDQAGGAARELVVEARGEPLGRVTGNSLHAGNVACAVAVALAIGAPRRAVAAALPTLSAPASRAAAAVADGVTVVDDTFNSNPAGARAALDQLVRLVPDGRRAVVTPGMIELGAMQASENREFAAHVQQTGSDLVAVGWTNRAELVAGHPGAVAVPDRARALAWVRQNLGPGDGVLWENDLPDHYP